MNGKHWMCKSQTTSRPSNQPSNKQTNKKNNIMKKKKIEE